MIGTTLGHYEILEEIGSGGMGVVYRALDTRLRREVALKLLPPELSGSGERLERFQREAESVARLSHPNIVTIHSVEEVDGLRFITMELVQGRTLDQVVPTGGLGAARFLEIAEPLADALAAAHSQGVIHRDIKPGNIMVGDDGRVKILDFGLAKLQDHANEGDADAADLTLTLAREDRVVGTVPYMSPEQVKGEPLDPRSDIFSLGVVFYFMALGRRPFGGKNSAELISSILRDAPSPVTNVRSELPRQLERIIDQCLIKNPEERFQTAKDLRNQLRSLDREIASREVLGSRPEGIDPAAPTAPRRWTRVVLAILLVVLAGWSLTRIVRAPPETPAPPTVTAPMEDARPALAVLYFRNLRDDHELDWLRSGLAEMMATDLLQNTDLRVASVNAVYQALDTLELLDTPDLSSTDLQRLTEELGVDFLLLGSFAQLGSTLQVSVRLDRGGGVESLVADEASGPGEASVFELVDQLGDSVVGALAPSAADAPGTASTLRDVTTSSLEAYRLYVEGLELYRQARREDALPLFERAVELDPEFAMALSRLATLHLTMGHRVEAREYARRAFEAANRSPARESHYIRGNYLALDWDTYPEAIHEYEASVALDPTYRSPRNTLGYLYGALDRFEDAVEQYESLFQLGSTTSGNYYLLATLYDGLGRNAAAETLLDGYVARRETSWYAHLSRGWHEVRVGRWEEALDAFDRAGELRTGELNVALGRWAAYTAGEQWDDALGQAILMTASEDPYWRWRGRMTEARTLLYRGRDSQALESLRLAAAAFDQTGAYASKATALAADIELLGDRPERALDLARRAIEMAPRQWPALSALPTAALALHRMGRYAEAGSLLADLRSRAGAAGDPVHDRLVLHLEALLELEEGRPEEAVARLERAANLLLPHGVTVHRHRLPDHASIWFSLGRAHLAAGNPSQAETWFRRLANSIEERRDAPQRWASSFRHLATLAEDRGDSAAARGYASRFARLRSAGASSSPPAQASPLE